MFVIDDMIFIVLILMFILGLLSLRAPILGFLSLALGFLTIFPFLSSQIVSQSAFLKGFIVFDFAFVSIFTVMGLLHAWRE